MRILHIGLSSIVGGIESFALNYFHELGRYGVIFDFVDIYGQGIARSEEIKAMGGKILTVPNYKKHPVLAKREITQILISGHYDSVHIHVQTAANLIPALAAKAAKVNPLLHAHVTAPVGFSRKLLHSICVPYLRRMRSTRLACSSKAGSWLWKYREFEVIPNAIDVDKYAFSEAARTDIRAELQIPEQTLVLGFVGRLEEVKNPQFLIKVAEKLETYGMDFCMVMLGTGSLENKLKETIAEKKLENRVKMLGLKTDVHRYLSAFDVYLMPSLHEALSLSAVEAQANSLCCLFSDTISEENKLTEHTCFLKLNDSQEWANKICELYNNKGCNRLSNQEIINHGPFNISNSGQKLLEIYKSSTCR